MANRPKTNPYGKYNRVPLRTNDFNKFIVDTGIYVRHDKTSICTCTYNRDSNHININCNLCDNGRIHFDSRDVWVLISQKKVEELFEVQGVWQTGDVMVTFPSVYEDKTVVKIDFFDRITILDFEERTSELIKRSATDYDRIRYQVIDVLFLRTNTKIYYINTDFEVDGKNIHWISANRPALNELYTLAYTFRPVYRIVNFFHEARYYYQNFKLKERVPTYLPIQAQARRDFIQEDRKNYD